MPLELRILGPLEVVREGREVPLAGARRRTLLVLLLTRANETVSADRLVDELWGDDRPQSAANALQRLVHELRQALGEDRIVTRTGGYTLAISSEAVDLRRFERLAEEGSRALGDNRPDVASERLREALALWRGPALGDLADDPVLRAEAARLEELRVVALERRIDAELELGRHADAVPELEGLVSRYPLRERFRGQLMLALYRSGRQADALSAYRFARELLVERLGLEPGPALQELEHAVLRQDPSLDVSPPAGRDTGQRPGERSILVVPSNDASVEGLLAVAGALASRPESELVVVRLIADGRDLAGASESLYARRDALCARGLNARAAVYTTTAPGDETVLLATELGAELVLVDAPPSLLEDGVPDPELAAVLAAAPCDVGVLVLRRGASIDPSGPVLVPFGGAQHEWAAIEIAAWIARSFGAPLRLVGVAEDAEQGRRDASRLLGQASLLLQRVVGVAAEPALVTMGEEGILEASKGAGLLVVGLSERWRSEGLGPARLRVVQSVDAPSIVVRRGLRPGALAPRESLTRFTWSLASG